MATIRRKKPESFAILSSPGPWPQVLINWLATLAVIIVFGLIMLFSASYTTGYLRMGDSFYYISRRCSAWVWVSRSCCSSPASTTAFCAGWSGRAMLSAS